MKCRHIKSTGIQPRYAIYLCQTLKQIAIQFTNPQIPMPFPDHKTISRPTARHPAGDP